MTTADEFTSVWGPYPNYDDIARFEYGRMMWRRPAMRARLLSHWTDRRHPYHERFARHQAVVEEVLCSNDAPAALDAQLRQRGTSLRAIAREIPPVFGGFFPLESPRLAMLREPNPRAVG